MLELVDRSNLKLDDESRERSSRSSDIRGTPYHYMVCRASVPFPFGDWEKHLPPINGAQAPPTPSLSFILKAEGVGYPINGEGGPLTVGTASLRIPKGKASEGASSPDSLYFNLIRLCRLK